LASSIKLIGREIKEKKNLIWLRLENFMSQGWIWKTSPNLKVNYGLIEEQNQNWKSNWLKLHRFRNQ